MTRNLFDPPPLSAERTVTATKPEAPVVTPSRPRFGPDVARAIETIHGPHRRVRGGGVVDEYYIVETTQGGIFEDVIGGDRRPAFIAGGGKRYPSRDEIEAARRLIVSSIESGLWREVRFGR